MSGEGRGGEERWPATRREMVPDTFSSPPFLLPHSCVLESH